jgi:hypothetical protein
VLLVSSVRQLPKQLVETKVKANGSKFKDVNEQAFEELSVFPVFSVVVPDKAHVDTWFQ